MPDIISIGEAMVELFADEPISAAGSFYKAYGGDTLNTLVAASRLGTSTGYVTRVGDDPFKDYLLSEWRKEGVDLSHTTVVPGENALYFISLLGDGQREFTYYRRGSAASFLGPEDINEDYIASAKILHVSGITQAISPTCREAVLLAVKLAKKHQTMVSYDPNFRPRLWSIEDARKAFEEILPFLDYFLPSEEDIRGLYGEEADHQKIISYFLHRGIPTVTVKCGSRGSVVGHKGTLSQIKAMKVDKVVDTTGAGDAFNGGFLHGLLNGMTPFDAAKFGTAVASLKLRARGAIAGLPSSSEAYALFEKDTFET